MQNLNNNKINNYQFNNYETIVTMIRNSNGNNDTNSKTLLNYLELLRHMYKDLKVHISLKNTRNLNQYIATIVALFYNIYAVNLMAFSELTSLFI